MKRHSGVSFALFSLVACSGSQVHPEPLPPEPVRVVAPEPAPAPAPEVRWSMEPHVAVRSPSGADFYGGTLVALSGSGTVVVYRRAEDAVVATARIERRLDWGEVVCGARECAVRLTDDAGGGGTTAYLVDLATGDASTTDSDVGYRAEPSGELVPIDTDGGYVPSSHVTAIEDGYDVETDGQVLAIRGITGDGEYAIHDVTVHPRGRGVLIHQRPGVVYVRASGARSVACLDERSAAFTPDGARVVQADDGICDPETDAGELATPEPTYGSGYGSSYGAVTPEEEPTYDDHCSPTDPRICIRAPYEAGAPLSLVRSGRAQRLAGTGAVTEIDFLPDGSAVVLSGPLGFRVHELPRGREIRALRREGFELIEVLRDGSLLVRTPSGVSLLSRDGVETHVTDAEVHAEGVTQHDDGSLYLCTSGGLSVREPGATSFRPVTNLPCGRVATLPSGVAVTSGVDGGERTVIALSDGRVIGTYGAPWTDTGPPLDAESFARCTSEGPLELLDVATLARRSVPDCDRSATYSADGSLAVRQTGAGVELLRTSDGTRLELRVLRRSDRVFVAALAEDGAFWTPSLEDAAAIDLARREDGVIVEALRGSSERALTHHHRPTLLSDFFEGRPLPRAGE